MVNQNLNVEVDSDPAEDRVEEELEQYLVFQCDELYIGVQVDYVEEAVINHSITPLPTLPDYIRGVINLRGEIVPIIDVRMRLGKSGDSEDSVIVLNVNGTQVGILVDRVDQMIKIPKKDILPMPTHNAQKLTNGICSLPEGGTMLVLNCPALLEL